MTAHAKVRVSDYLVGVVESKVRLAESVVVEAGEWVDHWGSTASSTNTPSSTRFSDLALRNPFLLEMVA